jgi:Uma2 family endonuclease
MEFVPKEDLMCNAEASVEGKIVLHGHIPFEIIDGKKYPAYNAASYSQSIIRKNLLNIFESIEEKGEYEAVKDVYVDLGDTILASDISLFHKPIRLREDIIDDIPIFVAEVVSPFNTMEDIENKKTVYECHPDIAHWIIDPENEVITVNVWRKGKYAVDKVYSNSDETVIFLSLSEKEEISVPVREVFAGLEKTGIET